MKNIFSIKGKISMFVLWFFYFSVLSISCSKEEDDTPSLPETNLTEIFTQRLHDQIQTLQTLLDNAVFGNKQGNYPPASRLALTDRVAYLEEVSEKLNRGERKLSRSDMDNIILETSRIVNRFESSALTEDFVSVSAELHVNGKAGGYIDFGASPEFSNFDNGFTVEFWVKFEDLGNFDYILSTFLDNQNENDRYRYGWAVNYYGEGNNRLMRMSYVMGKDGLFEPGMQNFNRKNEWIHLAYVWNPSKISDGSANPQHFKMYLNGQLVKEEDVSRTDYTPNTKATSMVGFNFTNFDGSISTEGKGTNGYMKHLHIWNSVKSPAQLQTIMNTPETVTGNESDLVCGWKLTETVFDETSIADMTGRYTARLVEVIIG